MYVCTKLYLVTVQEKVFVCSPMCFGKKRLYICVSLVHNILQKYTKISMHVCVIRISIHTSQRTPGVYCRRVSINKGDSQPFYTSLWEIVFFLHQYGSTTLNWFYWYYDNTFCLDRYISYMEMVVWLSNPTIFWTQILWTQVLSFFLTHTLIKHHEIGTVTGYTQKRVLSRNF